PTPSPGARLSSRKPPPCPSFGNNGEPAAEPNPLVGRFSSTGHVSAHYRLPVPNELSSSPSAAATAETDPREDVRRGPSGQRTQSSRRHPYSHGPPSGPRRDRHTMAACAQHHSWDRGRYCTWSQGSTGEQCPAPPKAPEPTPGPVPDLPGRSRSGRNCPVPGRTRSAASRVQETSGSRTAPG